MSEARYWDEERAGKDAGSKTRRWSVSLVQVLFSKRTKSGFVMFISVWYSKRRLSDVTVK